jgi:hypothetical protein
MVRELELPFTGCVDERDGPAGVGPHDVGGDEPTSGAAYLESVARKGHGSVSRQPRRRGANWKAKKTRTALGVPMAPPQTSRRFSVCVVCEGTALICWPSRRMAGIIRVAAMSLPPIRPQRITRTAFASPG